MSIATEKYNLVKPQLTDAIDISVINANWDKIDQALSEQSNTDNEILSGMTNQYNQIQNIQTQLPGYQRKITYGTAAPSGGTSGDIYIQLI